MADHTPTEGTAANRPPSPRTHLHGRTLVIVVSLWAIVVVLSVGVYMSFVPVYYRQQLSLAESEPARSALFGWGLSAPFAATWITVRDALITLVFVLIGIGMVGRRSNDWMTLFASLVIVTSGSIIPRTMSAPATYPLSRFLSSLTRYISQATFIAFLYVFPDGRFRPRWAKWLVILWGLLSLPSFLMTNLMPGATGWLEWPVRVLEMIGLGSGVAIQAYRFFHVAGPVERQQTRWGVAGFAAVFLATVALNLTRAALLASLDHHLAEVYYNLFAISLLGFVPAMALPLTLSFAALRYRLWDLSDIVSRTLLYLVLTGLLVGTFLGSVFLLQIGFRAMTGQDSDLALIVSTMVIVLLANPLRRRLQDATDRLFFRARVDVRRAVSEIVTELHTSLDLGQVCHVLLEQVTRHLSVSHGAVYLCGAGDSFSLAEARNLSQEEAARFAPDGRALDALHRSQPVPMPHNRTFALLLPLTAARHSGDKLVGILALGTHVAGQGYSRKEQALLLQLAADAGREIDVAQLTEALRESEAKFRGVFEQSNDAIVLVDEQGRVAEWNRGAERLTGLRASEMTGEYYWDVQYQLAPTALQTPETHERYREIMSRACKTGQAPWLNRLIEGELVRADGTHRRFQQMGFSIQTTEGFMVCAIIRDVTDSLRAKTDLEERLRFETLLSELSATFVNLPTSAVDTEVEAWLARIVAFLDVDRSRLYEFADGMTRAYSRYAFSADGTALMPFDLSLEQIPYLFDSMSRCEVFAFADIEDLPEEAAREKDLFRQQGLQSAVVIPLRVGGTVLGALAFYTMQAGYTWSDELVQKLRLVGEIFVNTLARKRSEEALRASTEKIRAMFESVPDGITFTDLQGNITELNESTLHMHGYDRKEELIGHSAFELITESDHERAQANMLETLQRGRSGVIEYHFLTKDGQTFDAELDATLLRDEEGDPAGFVALTRNITERKQVEREMRIKDSAIATSISAFALADLEGNLTYVNRAFLEQWGFDDPQEVLGRPALGFWQDPEAAEAIYQALLDSGSWSGQMTAVRDDGSTFYTQLSTSMVSDASGKPICMMASLVDISARVEAEIEIRKLNEDLERRVRERTAQLEEANRELESFAYSVSHDLRAPLRAINGFASILADEHAAELATQAQRYLHMIADNARQMGSLIDDLLAFSRLGRQALRIQHLRPADLVQAALEDVRGQEAWEGRQVEVVMGDLPPCRADAVLLKQVYTNLLSNAVKFTRTCDVARIEVGCQQKDGETAYYVRDNGIGFDMRYVDKLFGVFQRLHSEQAYEGSGVGLAIVQRIIRRHGGRVWAEAAEGKGATFYFCLGPGDGEGHP